MSVIGNWEVTTAEDLLAALKVATEFVAHKANGGHHASTVYTDFDRMVLTEDTLTDGSKVMNLTFVRVEENKIASRIPPTASVDPIAAQGRANLSHANNRANRR